ncbi:MAG: thiamine-phosphate kinase [Candidatus Sumerlaeia bacterium]
MPNENPDQNPLREIGEDSLIEKMNAWLHEKRGEKTQSPPWARMKAVAEIGDDCALVDLADGAARLALTTDMLVEGWHFLPDHPPERLGMKAAHANLSDLAAAGAWPMWILVSFGAPADTPVEWVQSLYRGMARALEPYGALCLGGDCVGAEKITINIVAGGHCNPAVKPPLRSKAWPGQEVYVTGYLGDSGAGFDLLQASTSDREKNASADADYLIEHHQCGRARVRAGIALAAACPDAAMMDLSDGIAADLPRIVKESNCGFEIRANTLPLSPALKRMGAQLPKTALDYALFGGEDFELLFTTALPPEKWQRQVMHETGEEIHFTHIGHVTQQKGIHILDGSERQIDLSKQSWKHF